MPDIRSISIAELGRWIQIYPAIYLDDTYLKYIGWNLHDKEAEVRRKCLDALLPLYEDEQCAPRLELFTTRFKNRLVSMALDREYECGVLAIRVIALIRVRPCALSASTIESLHKIRLQAHYPSLLTERDLEHVFDLVFCMDKRIGAAAGDFVLKSLSQAALSESTAVALGGNRSPSEPIIRNLVTFHHEAAYHAHTAYLVDSLIVRHAALSIIRIVDQLSSRSNRRCSKTGRLCATYCCSQPTASWRPSMTNARRSSLT